MGSAGSGKFGTYHVGNGESSSNASNGSNGVSGGTGGGVGEITCPSRIENIRLEDVATSEYFKSKGSLPLPGDAVSLSAKIYKGRLVVNETASGTIIGNMPTQYNYLVNCLKKGMSYDGTVDSSGQRPVPFIVVTLNA